MDRRLVNLLARLGLLLALSMVLVFGFWEHRQFYGFGLPVLLVGGGLVTMLVILGFRMAFSGQLPHARPTGQLSFTPEQGERILRRVTEATIRPADEPTLPTIGSVVRARYDGGREFARLRITEGTRKPLRDVSDAEARAAGYGSTADLRLATGATRPDGLVAILRFELVRGTA